MTRPARSARRPAAAGGPPPARSAAPPSFVAPQLCKLVDKAPSGPGWLHEVKFDGYRMAARIDRGKAQLVTRSGLDWTERYPAIAAALAKLTVKNAYLDGELCGVRPNGITSFALLQAATERSDVPLVYYAFDLLHLDGETTAVLPLSERKAQLARILEVPPAAVAFSDHATGDGEALRTAACRHGLEGLVSKRADQPYLPGNRGAWVKTKCLNRAEFIIVGWSDPKGSRALLGALLLGYYAPDGRLVYAGRAGTGMSGKTLTLLHQRLKPLGTTSMPLDVEPPRETRFGTPLALSRVHWVRPELVAEISFLTWTEDGLLRQAVFIGLRDDKPAGEVRRELPAP